MGDNNADKLLFLKQLPFYAAVLIAAALLFRLKQNYGVEFGRAEALNSFFVVQFLILFPVLEEYIFRGWFQQTLATRLRSTCLGIGYANVVVSLVFTACHFYFQSNILFLVGVFASSILFGYFYDRYKSLWPSVLLHVIYNGLILVV